jgi:hypothetical protein
MRNASWDVTPFGSSKKRCFEEHIASIFSSEDVPHDGLGRELLVTAPPQFCLSVIVECDIFSKMSVLTRAT